MIIDGVEFLIGADPECFIREKATGKLMSAHGMLPGDKKNPHKVEFGAVQVDGMAAEFNIDPARTREEFIHNIQAVMSQIQDMIGDEYELVATPVAHFGRELIDAQPDEAKELGCDPDFNAWEDGTTNPVPNVDAPFRTGAGHIHIGWTNGVKSTDPVHGQVCRHLIQTLDCNMLPTLPLDDGAERRELYGNAGAYRPKPYGVEYRTLSNFWIQDEHLIGLVYDLVELSIRNCVEMVVPIRNVVGVVEWKVPREVFQSYKGGICKWSLLEFCRGVVKQIQTDNLPNNIKEALNV